MSPTPDRLPDGDLRVIECDGPDWLLLLAGDHRLVRVSAGLGRRLRQAGLAALTPEESAEWRRLEEREIVSEANRHALREASREDGADLAVNLNLTAMCNLGCSYCFADGGDYGRITGAMERPTLEAILQFVQEQATASRRVRFEYFGGEPLLHFDLIEQAVAGSEELERACGLEFKHRVSTNLTVLPDGAVELFARKGFTVSVSIDGGEETHDRNRPTKGGSGSFVKIVANCRRLRRAAGDAVTLVARMTYVGGGSCLTDEVRELWRLDLFDYFQIYPGVVPAEKSGVVRESAGQGPLPILSEAPPTMSPRYLPELVDFLRDGYLGLFTPGNRFKGVLEYERLADMLLAGKTALSFCSGGRTYYTFSPDDSIMPCHRLVGDLDLQVGSSGKGLAAPLAAWRGSVDDHPVCAGCWARYACGGGCRQENLLGTGHLNGPNPEGCRHQLVLLEEVARLVARAGDDYRRRDRGAFDHLFVSCGRPVVDNGRTPSPTGEGSHFIPLA